MANFEVPFAIGETVWACSYDRREEWITCPDCAGTRTITLILGNGTQQSMECNLCQSGYDRPRGMIQHIIHGSIPVQVTCRRIVDFRDSEPCYSDSEEDAGSYRTYKASELYRDKAECEVACAKRNEENRVEDERRALANLESKRRSLAFSSHYWARQVKELERDLELARARLAVCKQPRAALAAKETENAE